MLFTEYVIEKTNDELVNLKTDEKAFLLECYFTEYPNYYGSDEARENYNKK